MLALSRSWVHYEVFLALQREGNLKLCFPRDVSTAEFKRFEAACRQLDPLSGSASRGDDKARILGEVRKLGGGSHRSNHDSGGCITRRRLVDVILMSCCSLASAQGPVAQNHGHGIMFCVRLLPSCMQLRASPGLKIMQKTTSEQLLTLGMLSMRWGGGLSAQAMYCCHLLDSGERQWFGGLGT